MSIIFGSIVPHPPILIPQIGRDNLIFVEKTKKAMETLAKLAVEENVETLVVISPHSPAFADAIAVKTGDELKGSFRQFGAGSVALNFKNNLEFVDLIFKYAEEENVPFFKFSTKFGFKDLEELDHGALVPLFYLQDIELPIVSLSISDFSYYKHYLLGVAIQKAAEEYGKRVGFIASGDLSHRLTPEAPAGFNRRGKEFDLTIKSIIEKADFEELFALDDSLIDDAGECGLRSIFVLAGSMNGYRVDSKVLSYEGPFGVGYLVAFIKALEKDSKRDLLESLNERNIAGQKKTKESESPPVKLARETVESYIKNVKVISPPEVLPQYMKKKAGVFVSINKNKALRGCIGTVNPTEPDIAMEIIRNAINASTNDPRFDSVGVSELDDLVYSVDILEEPEEIPDETFLDPAKYGVIVKSGFKTGLLLPNIEGVETVEEQLSIAKRKAGIGENERVKLYRFKVTRYY
ncbi:MAG: AmmeMemoRadiSam system protein A [Actinobacteria bacterium]|nr:AmmeMemoRadiSam system protein A [Actinomycetota bacterium]